MTPASPDPSPASPNEGASPRVRRRRDRLTAAQRFADHCQPLPAAPDESLEARVDRLDRSLDYLAQCFQDEFEVRDEGSLLIDVITQVLLPFAAISAAISLFYVRAVQWASERYPAFERTAALGYLLVLAVVLLVMVDTWRTGRIGWLDDWMRQTRASLRSSVPERKETLTRNNYVNRWIYAWIIGSVAFVIPLTFMALRSGVFDELGVHLAIDTAQVCDGAGRIRMFTGSDTCIQIQEENAPAIADTGADSPLGDAATNPVLSPIDIAETPIDAQIAEIRLDTTTTLALAVALLVLGILVAMAVWWWRNRAVRDIDVL